MALLQEPEDLSEEDKELQENLLLLVERTKDVDAQVAKMAIQAIADEIRYV